jgi:hypothetical protein
MTEDEAELLPFSFLKKYGSFINLSAEMTNQLKLEESRNFNNRWQ